jgi:hypothetical protein
MGILKRKQQQSLRKKRKGNETSPRFPQEVLYSSALTILKMPPWREEQGP